MVSLQWIKALSKQERQTWIAGFGGYLIDSFDFMIYPFLIPTLLTLWGMSHSEAGVIATCAMLSSAMGGWLGGILADRYGRVRVLQWTIVFFSIFTVLSGFTHSFEQLLITRTMQGVGFGGEWSVVTVMMSEVARDPRHRAKLVGSIQTSWTIGWGMAAAVYWLGFSLLPQEIAWRLCFWLGVLPAFWLIYIRRYLQEPAIFLATRNILSRQKLPGGKRADSFTRIFAKQHIKTTLYSTFLATGILGGYFSISTWLPTWLRTVHHLSVASTSVYMAVLITGALIGGLLGAALSDALGRRRALFIFAISAFLCTLGYMLLPLNNSLLLLLGLPLGMSTQGICTGIGAWFSELFPSEIRGSGQGFCFNTGRGIASVFPFLIGVLSNTLPLITAVGVVAGFCYLLVIICACNLPETRGNVLR